MKEEHNYRNPNEQDTLIIHVEPRKPRRIRPRILLLAFPCALIIAVVRLIFISAIILPSKPIVRESIAIIGAGPAGIAAADRLSRLSREKGIPLNITLFEQGPVVGGRLILHTRNSSRLVHPFDDTSQAPIAPEDITGPSLLSPNQLLYAQAKAFGDNTQFHERNEGFAIFDGNGFILEATRPSSATPWSSWLGQIYKYGSSVWRAAKLPTGTMSKARKLVTLDSRTGFPFGTVEEIVYALDLGDEVTGSAEDRLRTNGISATYRDDVIEPEMRRRLAQGVAEVHDLALSMAVQDEDQGSWKAGGRVLVTLEDMAFRSGADLKLQTQVLGVRLESTSSITRQWIVQTQNLAGEVVYSAFEKIILAAPWDPASLRVEGDFEHDNYVLQQVGYKSRHVTFFISSRKLSGSRFGKKEGDLPEQILPRVRDPAAARGLAGVDEIAFVRSVARVGDGVASTEYLYRVLSTQEIDDVVLRSFFDDDGSLTWVHRNLIPLAYPLLLPRTSFPPIRISNTFWHTASMETLISSLDQAVFVGMNVGGLVMGEVMKERVKQ